MNFADKVIKSNNIWTGNADETIYGGIAIKGNRIIYVGFQDLDKYIGSDTEVMDYQDNLVIPGLHDGHVHMLMTALMHSGKCAPLYDTTSEEQCVKITEEYNKPENLIGGWLVGMGWYQLLFDNKSLPTKKSLDKAFPNIPVMLLDSNCHTGWFNSTALQKLGFSEENTKDNNNFVRSEDGELSGLIGEATLMKVSNKIMTGDTKDTANLLLKTVEDMNALGMTQLDDVAGSAVPDSDQVPDVSWKQLEDEGKLTIRVNMYPTLLDDFSRIHKMIDECGRSEKDSMLGVAGCKSFFDGVSSMHTAYLSKPYSDAKEPNDVGHLTVNLADMQRRALKATQDGYCIKIHAIGDGAVTKALDVFENVENELGDQIPENVQFNMEHLENIEEKDIERLRDLNVIASVQPAHALIDPKGEEADLGEHRIKMMWPLRHYLARGVKMAFGTDTPVVGFNPYENMYNAVTRKAITGGEAWEPQNSIDIREALRAYTSGSAACAHRQNEVGTLEVGKLADVAVLDRNILEVSPEDMLNTKSLITLVDGKVVYREGK